VGHEAAGEIIDVAADVKDWVPGDRAAVKPALPCLTWAYTLFTFESIQSWHCSLLSCVDCTTGQSNICSRIGYYGAPGGPQDGALCTYKIVPVAQLARLTDKISWVEAGTIQPFAIALQMSRQAGLKANQNVMILGGGCIGLLLGAISKAYGITSPLLPILTWPQSYGAKKVVVLEIQPHRADFAKTYCADQVFVNPPHKENESSEDYSRRVAREILASVDGLYRGFDVVVEAAGALECMQIGIQVCRPGGTCKPDAFQRLPIYTRQSWN
jgi:D-xylulose reductase